MPAEKKYTNSFDLNYTLTYINPNSKTPLERTTLIVVSPELNPVSAGSFFGEIMKPSFVAGVLEVRKKVRVSIE